ncbi:MAG: MFS transporter [Actinomycetota bacterium]
MTGRAPRARGTTLGPRFTRLWAAFTATNLADGLSLTAFPLLAIELTDDARLVALVTVFRFVPFVLVGLPAGVLLDRFDRRRIAVMAQLGRGAAVAGLAVAVAADRASIALLVVTAFAVGIGEVLTDGGLPALVRELVGRDQLEVANGRFSATQTVSNIFVGPPLGALLFQLRPALPFAVSVALFVGATTLLARIPGRFRASPNPASPNPGEPGGDERVDASDGWLRRLVTEISVGLHYVWHHPVLRPMAFTVMAFSFVGQATNAVFVILVTERFGIGGLGFGLLISLQGVVAVAMSFVVARLIGRVGHSGSMRFAVVTFTASSLLFGFTTAVVLAALASLVKGLSDPAWNVVTNTVRQRLVPDEVFGRMMTAYLFIAWSMNPVGAFVGGLIAERWGAEWVSVMAAAVVGSLLILGRGLFRAIDEAMATEHVA